MSTGVVVGGGGLLDNVLPLEESLDEQPAIASAAIATAKTPIRMV
jgi:hypothetical protein